MPAAALFLIEFLCAVNHQPAQTAQQVHARQKIEQWPPIGNLCHESTLICSLREPIKKDAEDQWHQNTTGCSRRVDDAKDGCAKTTSDVGTRSPSGWLAPITKELGGHQTQRSPKATALTSHCQ